MEIRSNERSGAQLGRGGLLAILLAALAGCQAPAAPPAPAPGIRLVEDFVAACNAQDVPAIMGFFTEDAVYHNMPGDPAEGIEAVRAVIESYVPTADSIAWEILAISQVGDTVLTERVDRFVFQGRPLELPVMGAFELRDGKIAAWRDYFDMATWQRQMQGSEGE